MSHTLVKITVDEDGADVDNAKWCLSIIAAGGSQSFCSGQYYGKGESSCEFKDKTVQRGGITCPECLQKIKEIKAIKL